MFTSDIAVVNILLSAERVTAAWITVHLQLHRGTLLKLNHAKPFKMLFVFIVSWQLLQDLARAAPKSRNLAV